MCPFEPAIILLKGSNDCASFKRSRTSRSGEVVTNKGYGSLNQFPENGTPTMRRYKRSARFTAYRKQYRPALASIRNRRNAFGRGQYASTVPNVGLAARARTGFNTILANLNIGIPESTYVKFRYHTDSIPIALNPAATTGNTWRLTNLTDPNYTHTGHQCMLWDQFSTLYQWCSCYKVQIEFTVRAETGDLNFVPPPFNIGYTARAYDPIVGLASVYNDEWERPDSLCGTVSTSGSSTANTNSMIVDNARLVGKKSVKDFIDIEDYWVPLQSSTYTAPKELVWTMLLNNLSLNIAKIAVGLTITYHCKVFGKKHVSPSWVDGVITDPFFFGQA